MGDITYLRAGNAWTYLSTVIDLFSRKVIGWAFGRRIQTQLVRESFEMAMSRWGNPKGVSIQIVVVNMLSVSFVCNWPLHKPRKA